MSKLQDTIHKLEVGSGAQAIKFTAIALGLVLLLLGYNWRAYRNFATQEAMDSAQVALNLAEGKGFSTLFIRPFSIYLLTNHAGITIAEPGGRANDVGWLREPHPDLANPPLYPLVLAGLSKVLPLQPGAPEPAGEGKGGLLPGWWCIPDFCVTVFNQCLLVVVMVLSYFIARRLFDVKVAWLTVLAVLGAELLWRFSVSGLSTLFLMVIFLALVWVLIRLEAGIREGTLGPRAALAWCIAAAVLVGAGFLTRYSFGLLILPVIGFVVLFSGSRRALHCVAVLLVFLAVIAPWLLRNYSLSGVPMGTATYDIMKATPVFAEHRLERSLAPELRRFDLPTLWRKMINNGRQVVGTELPKLGGTWLSAFFLAGLLLQFNNPGINRMKYFVLIAVVLFAVAQTAFRTQLWEEAPDVNSENLLVLLTPMVTLFGVSMFVILRDQMRLPAREFRLVLTGLFLAVVFLPLVLALPGPRNFASSYNWRLCRATGGWFEPDDLIMSDSPAALAWYGRRPAMWLTSDAGPEFFAVHDFLKPVNGLFLTPRATDAKFLSDWRLNSKVGWESFFNPPLTGDENKDRIILGDFRQKVRDFPTLGPWLWNEDKGWPAFLLFCLIERGSVPPGFPLLSSPNFLRPDYLIFADKPRWTRRSSAE